MSINFAIAILIDIIAHGRILDEILDEVFCVVFGIMVKLHAQAHDTLPNYVARVNLSHSGL